MTEKKEQFNFKFLILPSLFLFHNTKHKMSLYLLTLAFQEKIKAIFTLTIDYSKLFDM